uniref:RING-type domain-containing protein n=1 Tax=Chromera velia CCMP2878 TaxID=1169474 RepID=A0A0G4GUK9_9ALVE|mmetsp:Transcript_42996/g.84774  ORF Transcript_42996/g.84774 Transcript_42996/m.84774 type:complete len:409 (+) Transcript_42996:252-1478(+)|eukprot:Cvel_23440.t1-p1 / transcript=Cvel_23440.t1 / gene=Cvel_23440 / organism=Chromera_velia_CCMP2878 / gene_product=E3 ubiquitin-protein ligase RNF181, putative / transcript_product=E3 ubiquitin-protein ligase RNF181, putative / location=Cvel_scaffold2416:5267-7917(+) / protein_length=408 / sequence_SO=supercontig / SO=protein_coding / is_pseudo=false
MATAETGGENEALLANGGIPDTTPGGTVQRDTDGANPLTRRGSGINENRAAVRQTIANETIFVFQKRFTILYLLVILALCSTVSYFMSKHWSAQCDKPLQIWIIIHLARHTIYAVLMLIKVHSATPQQRDPYGLANRMRGFEGFGFLWWILGFFWLMYCPKCDATIKLWFEILFYSQSAIYFSPCLLWVLIISCLPCLLMLLPYLISPVPNQSATEDAIIKELTKLNYGKYKELIRQGKDMDEDGKPNELAGYTQLTQIEDIEGMCPICFSAFEDGENILCLPCKPQHIFHPNCIEQWLKSSQLCPICRASIPDSFQAFKAQRDARQDGSAPAPSPFSPSTGPAMPPVGPPAGADLPPPASSAYPAVPEAAGSAAGAGLGDGAPHTSPSPVPPPQEDEGARQGSPERV